jgi:hypothetical protein
MTQKGDGARRLLLVVGIGRSGTSLLSGILGRLGFRVPQPEVLANDTNPRGFGEPRWVVDFHSRLMRARRVTVFDSRPAAWTKMAEVAEDEGAFDELRSWLAVQLIGSDNVLVKDPRIGWFLDLWLRSADDLGVQTSFVTMLRHPPEVVASARRWYGKWQTDASRAAAWLNITLQTEAVTREAPRAFVRYPDLLEDWAREIGRVANGLGLTWLTELDRSAYPQIDSFVEPDLRRSADGWEDVSVPGALRELVEEAWKHVSRLADPGDEAVARAGLDAVRAAYPRLYAEAEEIAQSSITAAKPGGGRKPSSRLRRAAHYGRRSVTLRAGRLLPRRHRERLRFTVKDTLEAGTGLPLPLRLMLLVPPRYRERVPTPVLRAGHRLVRSVRR